MLIEAVRFEDLLKLVRKYIKEVQHKEQHRPESMCVRSSHVGHTKRLLFV